MGHVMRKEFVSEAAKCRNQAQQYVGRPEEPFLLRLANAFEELGRKRHGNKRED
jgi:hypothetical protein